MPGKFVAPVGTIAFECRKKVLLPRIWRCLWGGHSCAGMAGSNGHGRTATEDKTAGPTVWQVHQLCWKATGLQHIWV